ncbi:MAG TPA: mandelate racemase/muconate lactonizing enzyme family protein [Solirubrobacteraceae bacterium]
MKLEICKHRIRLHEPVRAAWGELRERVWFEVVLTGEDGVYGRGEAAPLEPYDGVSLESCRSALDAYAKVLAVRDYARGGELLDACRAVADLPQALAAVDLALWDRAARREGVPVARLLAEDPLDRVPVNATIGALDRAGAADAAARAAAAGFECVKVKVGAGDDAGRVAAVRAAAGPAMALRLDANGAWSVDEAVRWIDALAPAGLELVEEPCHGVEAVRAVRDRVSARIAIDETAAEPGALAAGVADAICLKISRCGGISGVLAQAALAMAMGTDVYLASTYDGPLGIAGALHAAAALRVTLPCGLATLDDPGPLAPVDGAIAVPAGPGLL